MQLKDKGYLENFDFQHYNIKGVSLGSNRFLDGLYVLSIKPDLNPFDIATKLEQTNLFEVLEFDQIGKRDNTPNDPNFIMQWNLTKIKMPDAWNFSTGSSSVILSIIDSGIKYTHEDIDGNVWVNSLEDINQNGRPDFYSIAQGGDIDGIDNDGNGYVDDLLGWDFAGGNNYPQEPFQQDNNPLDTDGHGTNVAGISSAQTNNYESGSYRGIAGVAGGWGTQKGVSLMVLRDGGADPILSLTAQAIEYAAENGAKVINISTGYAPTDPDLGVLTSAVNFAVNTCDVVIVASAGNNGEGQDPSIRYPARYANTIAVGATDYNDSRRSYSAYGSQLDVVAPDGVPTTTVTGGYTLSVYGTSFSSPTVAGLAALIRSLYPDLSWQEVRYIIRTSADKVAGMGGQNFTNYYGYGRINAYNAVHYLYVPQVFSTIQSAADASVGNQWILIGSGTFNENITVSGKNDLTILGQPNYQTDINGNLTFYSCYNLYLGSFYCNKITTYYSDYANIYCDVGGTYSHNGIDLYSCSLFDHGGAMSFCNTGLRASSSDGEILPAYYISNNTSVTSGEGGWVWVNGTHLCESINYDFYAVQNGHIAASGCYYKDGLPRYHTFRGGTISFYSPYYNCSFLSKSSSTSETQYDFPSGTQLQSDDPTEVEFSNISNSYFNLFRTIKNEIKEGKISNIGKLHDQYLEVVNNFKNFMRNNPQSSLAKVALTTTVNSFRCFEDYNEMKDLLNEIITDNKLLQLKSTAENFMIDYYRNIKDFDRAINTADALIKNDENDENIVCGALLKKGLILSYEMNQPEKAIECLSTIVSNYSDNSLVEFAENELKILGVDSKKVGNRIQVTNNSEFSTNCYPNPFNPVATINYTLATNELVVLKVYDILGRKVTTLVNEVKQAGTYSVNFNATNLASGIYFYNISAGNFHQTKKMLLIR